MGFLKKAKKALKKTAKVVTTAAKNPTDLKAQAKAVKETVIPSGAVEMTKAAASLANPRKGAAILSKVTGGKMAGSNSILAGLNPVSVSKELHQSVKHFGKAFVKGKNPAKELFAANWHFTRAHPGADATRATLKKWGLADKIAKETDKLAAGVGGIAGAIGGPIAGAIAGGATGWGLNSQFGRESDYKKAYRSTAYGVGSGIIVGRAAAAFKAGGVSAAGKSIAGSASAGKAAAGAGAVVASQIRGSENINETYDPSYDAAEYGPPEPRPVPPLLTMAALVFLGL